MAVKDQELKREFIEKLVGMFEGAYQLENGKSLVIPYEGVELKLAVTVKKGGAARPQSSEKTLLAPNEQELGELRTFLEDLLYE